MKNKRRILFGFMVLCVSIGIIMTGCSNPADDDPILFFPLEDRGVNRNGNDPIGGGGDVAPPAPATPSYTAKNAAELEAALNGTNEGKEYNIRIDEPISIETAKIKGYVHFTTAGSSASVTIQNLEIAGGSTLQVAPYVTLNLTSTAAPSSSISASVNYDLKYDDLKGKIVVAKDGTLKATKDQIWWAANYGVIVYKGGIINDSELGAMTFTITEKFDSKTNYPVNLPPRKAGKYDAYTVVESVAPGLALVKSVTEQDRDDYTGAAAPDDNRDASDIQKIADWVPAAPASSAAEKYVYFGTKYADTLEKIAKIPYLTLVIGDDDQKTEWYEAGATYVILSNGTTDGLGANGEVIIKVKDFPVVLPQGKLSGGTTTGSTNKARIIVEKDAYLDIASLQTGNSSSTGYHGTVVVMDGGMVRDSAWMGWPLGSNSTFNIMHGGKIAVGEGKKSGDTTLLPASTSPNYASFEGWLIGTTADSKVKAVWETNTAWTDEKAYCAVTAEDVILVGSLNVKSQTGLIYNVNIAPGSVLTVSTTGDPALGTSKKIFAAKSGIAGPLNDRTDDSEPARDAGKLVLATGAGSVQFAGYAGGAYSTTGVGTYGIDTSKESIPDYQHTPLPGGLMYYGLSTTPTS